MSTPLSIQRWNYSYDNVNDSFKDFYMRLNGVVDRHSPMKKLKPKEIKLKSKPWLTGSILEDIQQRDKAFRRMKRQPMNYEWKTKYNQLRNKVNREIRKSKKEHYSNYFKEHWNNSKKTGKELDKLSI